MAADRLQQRPRSRRPQHARHHHRLPPRLRHQRAQLLLQHVRALGIVRRIQNQRTPPDQRPLPAARPARRCQSACDHLRRELPSLAHATRHEHRRRRVPALIVPLERRRRIPRQDIAKNLAHRMDRRPAPARHAPDHRLGFGRHAPQHHRTPFLDDARLFPGDLGDRIAQHLAMVEPDGRDHRHLRHDHIGRVEPSAEPGLDQRDVTAFP